MDIMFLVCMCVLRVPFFFRLVYRENKRNTKIAWTHTLMSTNVVTKLGTSSGTSIGGGRKGVSSAGLLIGSLG